MNKSVVIPGLVLAGLLGFGVWYYFSSTNDPNKDFELDKEIQQLIWDTEHITFEIETYFGKPFATALKKNDQDAFSSLMNPDLKALVLTDAPKNRKLPGFEVVSQIGGPNEETDAKGLSQFFRKHLATFDKIERAKTRVLKIIPVEGENGVWDTELLITAHGLNATRQPVKMVSKHHARFQYEQDEQIQGGGTAVRFEVKEISVTQARAPLMKEVSEETGLAEALLPDNWKVPSKQASKFLFQVAVEDFDRDGDLDIAVGTYAGFPLLLVQDKGKFVDRSRELGLQRWSSKDAGQSSLAGWVDINNDGYPELVMGQSIYRNIGGLRFQDITESSGFTPGYNPYGISVADFDGNGFLDIYVLRSNHFGQAVEGAGWIEDNTSGAPNTLWKNNGDLTFEDVTEEANAGGGNRTTFASTWFYYDDDHWPDLYIANDFARNVVLRNRGDGTFEDVSQESGAADFATSMGVAAGDLDNNGTTEIYVANMYSKMGRRIIAHVSEDDYPDGIYPQIKGSCAGNRLYQISDDGNYTDVTDIAKVNEVGWAFAPLLCDFDGDGLLDIYATTGYMSFDRTKPDG